MKITVWGKGHSSRILAKALGVRRNVRSADVAIRYGKVNGEFPKEINSAAAIKLSSNKFRSLQVMKAAEIPVPFFAQRPEGMIAHRNKIIFGRDFYHSKGTDIVVYQPNDELGVHEYYIQYLKPRAEYRYHVAFGKVILCTKKILTEGEVDDTLIRNHQNGKWKQVVCVETPRFSKVCVKAVKAHGLDFGAVDFLNVNREAVVLEVNTAPGLRVENRLEAYVKAIKKRLTSV